MSVSASIDIKINFDKDLRLTVIDSLASNGWQFQDKEGAVSYLPLGDADDFNWRYEKIKVTDLRKLFVSKINNNEHLGITMYWGGSQVGCDYLLYEDGMVLISLMVNRMITDEGFTDVNWYLKKIIPALMKSKLYVEHITFSECK